jgi:soluble lytic murein transglycosylase
MSFSRWLYVLCMHPVLLPLVAFGALWAARDPAVDVASPPDAPRSSAVRPTDAALIDSVLAAHAPGLGLPLRRQLAQAISEESAAAGYDPLLVLALIHVESDFDEGARSPMGARGLMQMLPSTLAHVAEREGLHLSAEEVAADAALCVRLGVRLLRTFHDQFGSLDLALMAYNAGPTRVRLALKEGDGEPPARGYARRVQREYRRFREGLGLDGDWALAAQQAIP